MATRLYETLEVQATATTEEIRKAYKKRALKTHPDRLGPTVTLEEKKHAEEQFREVNQAYEILTDPEKRKEYDLHGVWPPPAPKPSQSRRPHVYEEFDDPFSHPFFQNQGHNQFRSFAFTDPFALFESIFGDAHAPRRSGGPAYTTSTTFTFDDPFSLNGGGRGPTSDPFLSFPPFGGLFGALSTGGFRVQPFGAGSSNGQWASESFSTQTINGVTHTVHTRRDWEGNEHVTKIHGNGREAHTVNGVEQAARPQLQNQPSANGQSTHRRSSKDSAHFAPFQQQRTGQPQRRHTHSSSRQQPQYQYLDTSRASADQHTGQTSARSQPQNANYYPEPTFTQTQSQTHKDPRFHTDLRSGPSSSEGKRRRDSQRSDRSSYDASRSHYHQHPNKVPRNSSRQAAATATSSNNPFRMNYSSYRSHGGS